MKNETTRPDVSFLIAAFNAEGSIERAIRSAAASRDVSFEIIVADDCSTDATVNAVRKLDMDGLCLLTTTQNGGPGAARNRALDAARGRYVAIVDADDTIDPDRMARLVGRLDGEGADAIVDNLRLWKKGEEERDVFPETLFRSMPRLRLADFVAGNLVFVSRYNLGYLKPVISLDFLRTHRILYDETIRIGEDYLFLARILGEDAVCLTEAASGYHYRVTPGSTSEVLRLDQVERMIAHEDDLVRRYGRSGAEKRQFRRRLASLRQARSFVLAVDALKQRRLMQALRIGIRDPLAMRHFRMPLAARTQRLFDRFSRDASPRSLQG